MTVESQPNSAPAAKTMLLQQDVLSRPGWTRTLVKRFLAPPDEQHHRTGGGIYNLYALERVASAEATASFVEAVQASVPRRQAAAEASARRRQATTHYVETLTITVPVLSSDELQRAAIAHYNELWLGRGFARALGETKEARATDSPEFLARITVNYLRHALTNYERELARLYGRVGIEEAKDRLRERIYDEIARVYPQLEVECNHQLVTRQAAARGIKACRY